MGFCKDDCEVWVDDFSEKHPVVVGSIGVATLGVAVIGTVVVAKALLGAR
tara:strand:- start:65 stop:214 length:150 start_codon:yes stop_codon:yes gene_type:complete